MPTAGGSGTERLAPLFFVSPQQANFQVAPGTANGGAFLTFTSGDGKTSTGPAEIVSVAPGIFTANADGQGVPAVGLDQMNLGPLPRSLAGRGKLDVVITVDGKVANTVKINIE